MENKRLLTREEYKQLKSRIYVLSDLDYSYNQVTQKWDIPCIEWDGPFGKNWVEYESEEARDLALKDYQIEFEQVLSEIQLEIKEESIAKGHKKKEIKKLKTLGGQFSVLGELLEMSIKKLN